MLGADGAVEVGGELAPITGLSGAEAVLTLPAASVAFAVREWVPFDNALVVALHAPVEPTVAVPTRVVPS